jgi:hypothetical protein
VFIFQLPAIIGKRFIERLLSSEFSQFLGVLYGQTASIASPRPDIHAFSENFSVGTARQITTAPGKRRLLRRAWNGLRDGTSGSGRSPSERRVDLLEDFNSREIAVFSAESVHLACGKPVKFAEGFELV